MLHRDTWSLEFTPKGNSEATVLWTRHVERGMNPKYPPIERKPLKRIVDLHWGVVYYYYEQNYLTQEDSGLYTMRDKDKKLLHNVTIEVIANKRSYERSPGESFNFTFDLKPNSCNIYFIPESHPNLKGFETEIVRQGRQERKGSDEVKCVGFQLSEPCGILIERLQSSCGGRFEVKDHSDNMALVVSLKMKTNTRSYERSPGERLDFTFDLEPNSCNIYFFPGSDLKLKALETEIVRQGRLERKDLNEVNCGGFQLSKPCGILIESLQSSCGGHFEVRDQNGHKALVASLKMKRRVKRKARMTPRAFGNHGEPSHIAFAFGVFLLVAFFCICVKTCCEECCSKEDHSETEAMAASAPEVHDPTDDMPPSYSEV
ncbi:uncharacterized protein LOC121901431 [Thunnus maccoyii]|uniref:uncharacterized protein LOC121901431 n=1 Tax=Thunnus maccoyii TaxID=8240 RepID=UPI001C4CC75B|nr:uncharacterized protein LOC121901431 [Thunnus maccoyii]